MHFRTFGRTGVSSNCITYMNSLVIFTHCTLPPIPRSKHNHKKLPASQNPSIPVSSTLIAHICLSRDFHWYSSFWTMPASVHLSHTYHCLLTSPSPWWRLSLLHHLDGSLIIFLESSKFLALKNIRLESDGSYNIIHTLIS